MAKISNFEFDVSKSVIGILLAFVSFFLIQFYFTQKGMADDIRDLQLDVRDMKTQLHLRGIDMPIQRNMEKQKDAEKK
jgi:hypothetical protein